MIRSAWQKYRWRLAYAAALLPLLFDWRSVVLVEPEPVLSEYQRVAPILTEDWKQLRVDIAKEWDQAEENLLQLHSVWVQKPVDEHQLRRAERNLRRPFPAEYRELLMVHDGLFYSCRAASTSCPLPILEAKDQTSQANAITYPDDTPEVLGSGDWWNQRMWMLSDFDCGEGSIIDLGTGEVWIWSHDGGLYRKEHDDCLEFMRGFNAQIIDWAK